VADFLETLGKRATKPLNPLAQFLAQYNDDEWSSLISSMRAHKKLKETQDVMLSKPKEPLSAANQKWTE
jgi:hypothetical protein